MVKRWEDGQKVSVVAMDQDSEIAKVIRESRGNVRHEYDANHTLKALNRYCQELQKEERQWMYGLGRRSRDWFNHVLHQPIARDKKMEMWENTSIIIAAITSSVIIQHIMAISGRTGTCLKLKRVCDRIWVEGSKIIQKVDTLSRSIQANESFHALKGKCTYKRLNFTTSTEARLALRVISQCGNPPLAERTTRIFGHSPLQALCSRMLRGQESKH
jgi:hypothetical protein